MVDEKRVEQPPKPLLSEAAKRWQQENREAIDAWNAWVDINGLPLGEPDRMLETDTSRIGSSAMDDQWVERQPDPSDAAKQ